MHDHNHQCACGHRTQIHADPLRHSDSEASKTQMGADESLINADGSKHECQCGHCGSHSGMEKSREKEGCCGGECGCCEEEEH